MRVGMNPNVDTRLPPAPSVIAAVITHLPNRKGYHAQRFEVIQYCLESLRNTAQIPLYIWDNGSDDKFRTWLVKEAKPDYLTLSPNIGKATARTAILRTFPPRTVICYSDDDIEYLPGWLDAQLELLNGFPNVGVVSGCPIRTQFRWGNQATLKWANDFAILKSGRWIPNEWELDFCRSIGRDYTQHMNDSADEVDYKVFYQGLSAYCTAHHMQFIGYAEHLGKIGLWTDRAMRVDQSFDVAIDRMGLLRLTTIERYTRHIGNVLEAEYAAVRV
jgi:glycosyltransferase involved in cell wall biosynthesis